MDLLSIVFKVRPLPAPQPRPLPRWWGAAVQSLVFEALRESDPDGAAALHADPSAPRPFTASNLIGPRAQDGALPADALYTFRLTSIAAPQSAALLAAAQPGGSLAPGAEVQLDYLPFKIEGLTFNSAEDAWAGSADYPALVNAHLLTPEPPERQISFQLYSPTAFRSNERIQPLPLPHLVFHSLLARWNAYAPLAFPPEVERYAEECLAISRFELSSRSVAVKGGLRVGAVGRVTFTALNFDRYWQGVLHTLAAFAFYAGIGAVTGMGMGQARVC